MLGRFLLWADVARAQSDLDNLTTIRADRVR